jgi:hypothetical protein
MGWALFELQAGTDIEKQDIHKIFRENLHLCNIALNWVPHALNEVEKRTRYATCH